MIFLWPVLFFGIMTAHCGPPCYNHECEKRPLEEPSFYTTMNPLNPKIMKKNCRRSCLNRDNCMAFAYTFEVLPSVVERKGNCLLYDFKPKTWIDDKAWHGRVCYADWKDRCFKVLHKAYS